MYIYTCMYVYIMNNNQEQVTDHGYKENVSLVVARKQTQVSWLEQSVL